jgi:hypothetical protein
MSVDRLFAQWLMGEAFWHVGQNTVLAERWGDTAVATERLTAIANKVDAVAEANRQISFLGGPLVADEHLLTGQWRQHIGQVVTITGDRLGYEQGSDVFLLSAEDDLSTGLSKVIVLRRL